MLFCRLPFTLFLSAFMVSVFLFALSKYSELSVFFCVCLQENEKGSWRERHTQIEILMASLQHRPGKLNTQHPKAFGGSATNIQQKKNKNEKTKRTHKCDVLLDMFDNIPQLV